MLQNLVKVQKEIQQANQADGTWFQLDKELEYHDFFGAKMSAFAVALDPYINAFSDHFGFGFHPLAEFISLFVC